MAPEFEDRQEILDDFDEHFIGKDGRFKEREFQKEIYYEVVRTSRNSNRCPVLKGEMKFEDAHKKHDKNGNGKDTLNVSGRLDMSKIRTFVISLIIVIAAISGSTAALKLLGV